LAIGSTTFAERLAAVLARRHALAITTTVASVAPKAVTVALDAAATVVSVAPVAAIAEPSVAAAPMAALVSAPATAAAVAASGPQSSVVVATSIPQSSVAPIGAGQMLIAADLDLPVPLGAMTLGSNGPSVAIVAAASSVASITASDLNAISGGFGSPRIVVGDLSAVRPAMIRAAIDAIFEGGVGDLSPVDDSLVELLAYGLSEDGAPLAASFWR
jgi:hypothetical protein